MFDLLFNFTQNSSDLLSCLLSMQNKHRNSDMCKQVVALLEIVEVILLANDVPYSYLKRFYRISV
jgi:hypothetical protein